MTNYKQNSLQDKLKKDISTEVFYQRLTELGIIYPAPYNVISSPELAKAFQVSTQTMANWRMRGIGPVAEPVTDWSCNRNHYEIAKVLNWLTGIEYWKIYQNWLAVWYPHIIDASKAECEMLVREIIQIRAFPQHKWQKKKCATREFLFEDRCG